MPVKNFAPEFLELYRLASESPQVITLASEKDAIRLRFRLHDLRRAMRKESHHMLPLAELVQFQIHQEGDKYILTAAPSDSEFLDELRAAGIKVSEDTAIAKQRREVPLPEAEATTTALERFMKKEEK